MMLAEPKYKTAWTLNPRGKLWSNDKNKIGQKLLEKMGWQEGKGLGKNEDGMVDHLRVKHKDNNEGMGYQVKYDDRWIESNHEYEHLLTQLSQFHSPINEDETKHPKNLEAEEVVQKSRKRIHNHKLVKAKSLSQCTSQDLASLFPDKKNTHHNKEDNQDENHHQQTNEVEKYGFKTVDNKTNINDYFKMKMEKLRSRGKDGKEQNYTRLDEVEVNKIEDHDIRLIDNNNNNKKQKKQKKEKKEVKEEKEELICDAYQHDHDNYLEVAGHKKKDKCLINDLKQLFGKKRKRNHEDEDKFVLIEERNVELIGDESESSSNLKKRKKRKKQNKGVDANINVNPDDCVLEEKVETSSKIILEESVVPNVIPTDNPIGLGTHYDIELPSVKNAVNAYSLICDGIANSSELKNSNLLHVKGY